MSVHDAMIEACAAVGIKPPQRTLPGRWVQADTLERNGKGDGRVMLDADGRGGTAYNWQTGQHTRFRDGATGPVSREERARSAEIDRAAEALRAEAEAIARAIVRACQVGPHPYLARKGFPDERGLILDDVRAILPDTRVGRGIAAALPEGDGPFLIVPGQVGAQVRTVQIVTPEGAKKNLRGCRMGGAAHRIATGRETWVCEGIATALSVRAALRFLGRSATVLSAFSAQNVCKVATGIPGAIIAADHDKPVEHFGCGTGEHYARQSGRVWVMPPAPGDWNDLHQAEGLRAVALALREVRPP